MKRLFIILITAMMAVGVIGQVNVPKVNILGDLHPYKYVYIIPTGSVTSSTGSATVVGSNVVGNGTKTVNPSEILTGYLIKQGYTILPELVPELAEETMIFSYGHAGISPVGIFAYASKIIIQITNGKTHELLATIEAQGCGSTETDDINIALNDALNSYTYSFDPKLKYSFNSVTRNIIDLNILNETPDAIKHIAMMISYYMNDSIVHQQKSHIVLPEILYPGKSCLKSIYRDKVVRNKNMEIKIETIGYE